MATKEFKLPDVGEGVAEGELVSWLVEPGDTVSEDQPVAEVETDKALVEVPSPYNGTVEELLADEGEMVPVGDVIITFEVDGEAGDADVDQDDTTETEAADAEAADAEAADAEAADVAADEETTDAEADAGKAEAEGTTEASTEPNVPEGRIFAAPSARRLARELGVELSTVDGTGPGGRVSETDVRQVAESGDGAADEAAAAGPESVDQNGRKQAVTKRGEDGSAVESDAESTSLDAEATESAAGAAQSTTGTTEPTAESAATAIESADRDRTLAVPATRKVAREEGVELDEVPTDETRDGEAFVTAEQVREFAAAQRGAADTADAADAADAATVDEESVGADVADVGTPEGGEETVPYRGVRRTIGQQMERSKYTAPHVSHHDTAEVSALAAARADLKSEAEKRDVKLTYMPFVMKAVVAGLKQHPYLNSELREDEEEIALKKEYNIGIAVATDAGLMVPVVKHVDRKGLVELAAEVNDLASRARERKITAEEMKGGTFTITNFGAIGGEYATPIINYPETAILGLGAIEDRPVVRDGEVVAEPTLPLSMSIDHRVIDGAEAAQFANTVMQYLEEPTLLLLE